MINLEHRAMAQAAATGEVTACPEAQFHKAYMYGLVPFASGFAMPRPADVIRGHEPLSVHDVTGLFSARLLTESDRVLDTDEALLAQLDETVSQRMRETDRQVRAEPAKKLVRAGMSTGIDVERATLATVQARSDQAK